MTKVSGYWLIKMKHYKTKKNIWCRRKMDKALKLPTDTNVCKHSNKYVKQNSISTPSDEILNKTNDVIKRQKETPQSNQQQFGNIQEDYKEKKDCNAAESKSKPHPLLSEQFIHDGNLNVYFCKPENKDVRDNSSRMKNGDIETTMLHMLVRLPSINSFKTTLTDSYKGNEAAPIPNLQKSSTQKKDDKGMTNISFKETELNRGRILNIYNHELEHNKFFLSIYRLLVIINVELNRQQVKSKELNKNESIVVPEVEKVTQKGGKQIVWNSQLEQIVRDQLDRVSETEPVKGESLQKEEKQKKQTDSHNGDNTDLLQMFLQSSIPSLSLKTPQEIVVFITPGSITAIDDIPWKWLREEKWRLHTFAKYPHKTAKSAILLAANGFAYYGTGKGSDDNVICYFCCKTKRDWQASDDISEVHRTLSPECSMVTGINCDNVPMTSPGQGSELFNQLDNATTQRQNQSNSRQQSNDQIQTDSVPEVPRNSKPSGSPGERRPGQSFQMANTTIMRPSPAPSANVQASTLSTPATHQPDRGNAPSNTVTSAHRGDNNAVPVPQVNRDTALATGTAVQQHQNHTASVSSPAGVQSGNLTSVSATTTSGNSAPSVPSSTSAAQTNRNTSTAQVTQSATVMSSSSATAASSNQSQTGNGTATQGTAANPQGSAPPNRPPTYSDLGIITERPKRIEYAVKEKRLETFNDWPVGHHLKKEDLADAGFYYAGYGDCARCFYCGGGLRNWEDDDTVLIEHARWFPKCAFMRQQMGQTFIDVVQDLNREHDKISMTMVEEKLGAAVNSFSLSGARDEALLRDPAVMTVIDMGYSKEDCLEAARFVRNEEGTLSADKIYEKLVQEEKQRTENLQSTARDVKPLDPAAYEDTLKTLKEQNSQLRQQTVCKICMDKEVAVVFLPCGHLVSCTDCASAMKDCPVCRKGVKGIVRAFMS